MTQFVLAGAALLLADAVVVAEVVQVQIERREPFAAGHSFGRSGPYERVIGKLHLVVDPLALANQRVIDLKLAPRNDKGQVQFWTDFFLLKPVDPSRGNRRLLYDVNNRGNKLAVQNLNKSSRENRNDPTTLADAGDGFLMRLGYSILWCGWDGDVLSGNDRLLVGLPVAQQGDKPVTGKIHVEFCRDEQVFSQPIGWGPFGHSNAYPSVSLSNDSATLSMRPRRAAAATTIPQDRWSFARLEHGRPVADPTHIHIHDGMQPGWLYDLVYTGRNPRVTGLGFVAVRDCVSSVRYGPRTEHAARNSEPLAETRSTSTRDATRIVPDLSSIIGEIEHAYAFGISQSGRFIHHFLYEGFNTDEMNRMVFDGVMIHVAGAGKGLFNYRFGLTTEAGRGHQYQLSPSEFFPFATARIAEPVGDPPRSTLDRAHAQGHVPKIIFTNTSTEYWSRAGSLLHTDPDGKADLKLDENVRLYLIAGAQHLGAGPPTKGICQFPRGILNDRPPILRAMLVALDRWVSGSGQPPESRYPRISDGTLVDLKTWRESFPRIPRCRLPQSLYEPRRLDPGPRWQTEGLAEYVPPRVGQAYRVLVPAVDMDGNELAGVRLPDIVAPLATHTGWNLRSAAYGAEGMLAVLHGAHFPLPKTPTERRRSNDPRRSILERYPSRSAYLARVTDAALALQQERFLLAEDVIEILNIAASQNWWEPDPD